MRYFLKTISLAIIRTASCDFYVLGSSKILTCSISESLKPKSIKLAIEEMHAHSNNIATSTSKHKKRE